MERDPGLRGRRLQINQSLKLANDEATQEALNAGVMKKWQEFMEEEIQIPSCLSEVMKRLEQSPIDPAQSSKDAAVAT